MLRICMIEAAGGDASGSIGPWYVVQHAKRAGHEIDFLRLPKSGYDVEMISVHHVSDYERLAHMPKRAKVRIIGGHVTTNNVRPLIPFADAICIGEGESWIGRALKELDKSGCNAEALRDMEGTIVCKEWVKGMPIPAGLVEDPLPDNPPYLNRPGTRSAAWYVEIARGCPYACSYCELGHAIKHRNYTVEQIRAVLELADTKITRKINPYAPDEASHPEYNAILGMLRQRGYAAGFASMRIDTILKNKPNIKTNMLIRVGVDGLTEATRKRVRKNISNELLVRYFKEMTEAGHVNYKMFMMFGYPWEKLSDFNEFEMVMGDIFRLPLNKNISLRIKWTPLIPQPSTPLGKEKAEYNPEMACRIMAWHGFNARPSNEPGIFLELDGLMGWKQHALQCRLTSGDEYAIVREWPTSIPLHKEL